MWAYVDLAHGLALWFGSREDVETHYESIRVVSKKMGVIDQFNERVRLLSSPGDVDECEMDYMRQTCRLPRRVMMRLRKTA